MIRRNLTDDLEGYVELTVRGSAGDAVIDALVDTGFNGFLSLSRAQITELDLEWSRYETAELADGEEVPTSVFDCEVLWGGQWRAIEVAALGTDPLLGMELLRDHRLLIDVIEGGQLTITPLAQVQRWTMRPDPPWRQSITNQTTDTTTHA